MDDATVVCVLGMHRSGTSLVSRILNLIGYSLGPEDKILGPRSSNPKGHWEYRPFVEINDEILSVIGGSWDRPPPFPEDWQASPNLEPLKDRVEALLEEDFSGSTRWAWKDPRTSLTLPFWQELLPDMCYIVCLRNPLDVGRSLRRRDRLSQAHASRLWLRYVSTAIDHTQGRPRLFVSYEQLMHDWKSEVDRLADFLGEPHPADNPKDVNAIGEAVDSGLQHHRSSPPEVLAEEDIPFPALALYLVLYSCLQTPGGPGPMPPGHRASYDMMLRPFSKLAQDSQAEIEDMRAGLEEPGWLPTSRAVADTRRAVGSLFESKAWRLSVALTEAVSALRGDLRSYHEYDLLAALGQLEKAYEHSEAGQLDLSQTQAETLKADVVGLIDDLIVSRRYRFALVLDRISLFPLQVLRRMLGSDPREDLIQRLTGLEEVRSQLQKEG